MLVVCIVLTVLAFVIPGVGGTVPHAVSDDGSAVSTEGGEPDQAPDGVGEGSESDGGDAFDSASAWLPADMDSELAGALRDAAATDENAAFALSHAEDYARFGAEYQTQLLELAAEESAARPFVVQVLSGYPASMAAGLSASDRESGVEGSAGVVVPRLYQWDARWGCLEYSSAPLGVTGCCPTSLSMVYTALTGKLDRSPADLARLAQERGFVSEADGTFAEFLPAIAPELGLRCEESRASASSIREKLSAGAVLICNVGPGEFTDGGHFFVITALNADGSVSINDPYSQARSEISWDPERLARQSIGLYAFWSAS